MPQRWRARLKHHFWRPDAFRRQLRHLVDPSAASGNLPAALLKRIAAADAAEAVSIVAREIDAAGHSIAGTRTLEEIAEHLAGLGADLGTKPLEERSAELIEAYLKTTAAAADAPGAIANLLAGSKIDIRPALAAYEQRLALIAEEGVDVGQAVFSAGFGRQFEYYTGFVFEIRSPALGDAAPICGGGRYDTLLQAISAGAPVPAVGAAIHAERLLLAVRGGRP